MSVFAKTQKGLDALRDMRSEMPRRMRTLLWCINGQTSTGTLIRSLTSLGDVKDLMRTLIADGLIERVHRSPSAGPGLSNGVSTAVASTTPAAESKWNSASLEPGVPGRGQVSSH
jgi:hypothetical protein